MKKLFIILFILLIPKLCFAAMSATITWEFNSSATANMVNGGGFKTGASGTDYSTATGAHLTITDLVIGADNTTVTSALTPFDTQDVGNVLHITAGTNFTAGWYEVTAVNTAVASLDRACGTALATGGTAYLGGALSLNSTLDDEFHAQLVAGQIVWWRSGNYTLGEAIATAAIGTTTLPIYMKGYVSTRGDACNNLDRPIISCGTYSFRPGNYWWIQNIRFVGTGNPLFGSSSAASETVINCKFLNNSATARVALLIGTLCFILNNEVISPAGTGITTSGRGVIQGNYIHHSSTGISAGNNSVSIIKNNIIANISTTSITLAGIPTYITENTLYGSEGKIATTGINCGAYYGNVILNNIIYGFVTGISATASDTQTYLNYNNLYNNTTPVSNVTELGDDISVNPGFTNAAGTLIDSCETQWSYSDGDVTLTADPTVYKVGVKSMKAVCAANFGAGDIACAQAITSTNMSTYNGFGLWVRSDVALVAGDWQFVIDDTANCASPIGTFNLPGMSANTWYWLYLDGLDMSTYTAIISIGFKQVVDKGAMTLYADDVRACDNDFTFSSSSGGGIGAGFPQSMPGAKGDYQMNIGVDQSDHATGGGGVGSLSVSTNF